MESFFQLLFELEFADFLRVFLILPLDCLQLEGFLLLPARREINIYYLEFFIPLLNVKKAVIIVEKSDKKLIIKEILRAPEKADGKKMILII